MRLRLGDCYKVKRKEWLRYLFKEIEEYLWNCPWRISELDLQPYIKAYLLYLLRNVVFPNKFKTTPQRCIYHC
jgi:hypothetical protein